MIPYRVRWLLITSVLALTGPLSGQPAFNYAEALQKSMFFYEAQQSGVLPESNRVTWRGDSALDDGGDVGVDLIGGWYDGGDHVKFGFPMAFTATALAWGAIDFRAGYVAAGQLQLLKNNLRFVNDYFIRAHTAPNELWGQVGDPPADHAFWGSAEILMMPRPAFKIDESRPGSELAAETAAAMAAASIVFAVDDPTYSATLLRHAIQLYHFADNFRGLYSTSIPKAETFYRSFSGFDDELVWGAIWLYRATGDVAYLNKAETYFENLRTEPGSTEKAFDWTTNWDDKSFGSYVLLAKLTGKTVYKTAAERNLDYWTTGVNGRRVSYSPGGLAVISTFNTLALAANASFLALYYHEIATTPDKAMTYYNFGVRQMNYALGANPLNRSYVVGFGVNPPRRPNHRTAHGAWANRVIDSPTETRHILYGALVSGPRADDSYVDERSNFQSNGVSVDQNALFSGALAKLTQDFGGSPLANFPEAERSLGEYLVEAKINAPGARFSDFSLWANNHTAWPARIPEQVKFRVFIDITEGLAAGFTATDYLVSSGNSNVSFTPLLRWAAGSNIYYTEVAFLPGTLIWPGGLTESRQEVHIRIGLPLTAPAAAWNAANDWSTQGVAGTLQPVGFIPLYADGVLVAGAEPPRERLVPVTGIRVQPAFVTVMVGTPAPLSAEILPANASNQAILWTSLNPTIASVSPSGVVTAIAAGTAVIRATTAEGGFNATTVVLVLRELNIIPCAAPTPITLNFAKDGAGEFCYVTTGDIAFINSWNMQLIEINGLNFTNRWTNYLPAKVNGLYIIRYVGQFPWSHLEINGTQ